jgi:DNA-binding MarR family transcriptional regulator
MNEMREGTPPVCGTLLHTLMETSHQVEHRLEEVLQPQGLSLPKLVLLHQLIQAEAPVSLSDLSLRLGCAKSNITQLVDRLEADALVERLAEPGDRRGKLAAITERGRHRYTAARQAVAVVEQDLVATLPASERDQLAAMLRRFRSAVAR